MRRLGQVSHKAKRSWKKNDKVSHDAAGSVHGEVYWNATDADDGKRSKCLDSPFSIHQQEILILFSILNLSSQ